MTIWGTPNIGTVQARTPQSTLGEYLGASAEGAWEDSPMSSAVRVRELEDVGSGQDLASAIGRIEAGGDLADAMQARPPALDVPIADAKARVKEAGLEPFLHLPDQPAMAKPVLDIMIDRAETRKRRASVIERGPDGIVPTALFYGTSFLVSAVDPLNVASAFVPVVGEMRYANMLANAGESLLARGAVRAKLGAIEGAVGQAMVEPLVARAKLHEGQDYTAGEALRSLMFGGAFGAGLHVGAGGIRDVYRARKGEAQYPYNIGEPLEFHTPWDDLQAARPSAAADRPVLPEKYPGDLPRAEASRTVPAPDADRRAVFEDARQQLEDAGMAPEEAAAHAAMMASGSPEANRAIDTDSPQMTFRTAKGSTYSVHADGTTTRDKAARADLGHEGDSGLKPRTAKTIYVDADVATALSGAGITEHTGKGWRVAIKDGKATLLSWNEKANMWGAAPSGRNVPFTTAPEVGKAPVELWKRADDVPGYEAYSRQHAGNKITEVSGPSARDVPAANTSLKVAGKEIALDVAKAEPTAADFKAIYPEWKRLKHRMEMDDLTDSEWARLDALNQTILAKLDGRSNDNAQPEGGRRPAPVLEALGDNRTNANVDGSPKAEPGRFNVEAFHGTTAAFDSFAPEFLGSNTGAPSARMGFFFSKKSDTANSYARRDMEGLGHVDEMLDDLPAVYASKIKSIRRQINRLRDRYETERQGLHDEKYLDELEAEIASKWDEIHAIEDDLSLDGANVRPVRLRMDNPLIFDFGGSLSRPTKYAEIIGTAKAQGHDSVLLKNTFDGSGLDDIYVVFEPEQIQSRFASPVVEALQDLPRQVKEDITRAAIASVINGEPVRVMEMLDAAAKTDPRIAESMALMSPGAATPQGENVVRGPRSARGPRARDERTYSLMEFLAHNGGLRPDPELAVIFGGKNPFVPGFGRLIRDTGMSLDRAREASVHASYLPDAGERVARDPELAQARPSESTPSDLLKALDDEARGSKQYRNDYLPDRKGADRDEHLRHLDSEFDHALRDAEIDPQSIPDKQRARVIQMMEREGETDPLVAWERAVMEEGVDVLENSGRRRSDETIPGWDVPDDAGPAPFAGRAAAPGRVDGAGGPARGPGDGGRATPSEAAWRELAADRRPENEPDAIAASRAADALPEPGSNATDPSKRVAAAEKAAADADALYADAEAFLPDEVRLKVDADLKKLDIDTKDSVLAIQKGAACLAAAFA